MKDPIEIVKEEIARVREKWYSGDRLDSQSVAAEDICDSLESTITDRIRKECIEVPPPMSEEHAAQESTRCHECMAIDTVGHLGPIRCHKHRSGVKVGPNGNIDWGTFTEVYHED